MSVTLLAVDLVRVLTNVSLFASTRYPVIRLRTTDSALTAMATDSYMIGTDTMSAHGGPLVDDIWLSEEEVNEIVKHSRLLKKKGLLSVDTQSMSHTTAWTFSDDEGPIITECNPEEYLVRTFGHLDRIMEDLPTKRLALPEKLELDRNRLAKIGRIRTGKDLETVRFMIHDNRRPMLFTVGQSFCGALVPIDSPDGWLDE